MIRALAAKVVARLTGRTYRPRPRRKPRPARQAVLERILSDCWDWEDWAHRTHRDGQISDADYYGARLAALEDKLAALEELRWDLQADDCRHQLQAQKPKIADMFPDDTIDALIYRARRARRAAQNTRE